MRFTAGNAVTGWNWKKSLTAALCCAVCRPRELQANERKPILLYTGCTASLEPPLLLTFQWLEIINWDLGYWNTMFLSILWCLVKYFVINRERPEEDSEKGLIEPYDKSPLILKTILVRVSSHKVHLKNCYCLQL